MIIQKSSFYGNICDWKAKFAESLAPGQEMEFLEMLDHNESDDEDADVPEDVKNRLNSINIVT